MPDNDEVVEVYTSELNLMVDLSAKIAAGNLQAVDAIKGLVEVLTTYAKGTAKRDAAFKAAVEGLTITNVVNVPEQAAPAITVVPSEVIIQQPREGRKSVSIAFSRDGQGRITGANGTIE